MSSTKPSNFLTGASGSTVSDAQSELDGKQQKKNRLLRILPFLGPAFIASVAYVDPGNFATNIQGGSRFGYLLLWVVVVSNLMAVLIQSLAAKLGLVTGRNLAEQCRLNFSKPVTITMWTIMELVAMATDLAEFLGAALGFHLLFGMPLIMGGLITAVVTFVILGLERYGFRPMEATITSFVGVIAICYVVETLLDKPQWGRVFAGAFVPGFDGSESVLLAAGILGATVMPHAIFLHSALMQGRVRVTDPAKQRRLYRFELIDVVAAMSVAGVVNAAILIMAASTFHHHGMTTVASIEDAHLTLRPLLGPAAGVIFALSLLASGLSSSTVGTSAGQVMMQGFLKHHIPVWLRRIVTMAPSLAVIGLGLDPTRTMVISQVVLSFGLPFAIIPLVMFTGNRRIMGSMVNRPATAIVASAVAGLVVLLNIYLLIQTFAGR